MGNALLKSLLAGMACFPTSYVSATCHSLPAAAAPLSTLKTSSEPTLEGIPLSCRSRVAPTNPNGALKVLELTRISGKYIEVGQKEQALKILTQTLQVVTAKIDNL